MYHHLRGMKLHGLQDVDWVGARNMVLAVVREYTTLVLVVGSKKL